MSTDRSAMILVAHADDETLGCGGTIQLLLRDGWSVDVVIVSEGVVTARGGRDDNASHAPAACATLGLTSEPRFLGFPDQRFDTVAVAEIANAASALGLQPDLIITHVGTDLNGDHRVVNEAARILGRPRTKPVTILGCEIPSTSFWGGTPFPANYFVGLTEDQVQRKIDAFGCYANELREYPHPWSREALRLLAQFHGMQSGHEFAEAFQVIRGYSGLMP